MLTVASSDQFELLDVNDAVLAKSFLDGRMDREHFMAAVGQALWREDLATLEELANQLRSICSTDPIVNEAAGCVSRKNRRQKRGAGGEGDALYTRIAWSLTSPSRHGTA